MNILIKACVINIGKKVGLGPNCKKGNEEKETWWKRRIKQLINELQKHINILKKEEKSEIKSEGKYQELELRCKFQRKGLNVAFKETKNVGLKGKD